MYLQHFGLKHAPLGKGCKALWDEGQLAQLSTKFKWLLESPGIGLLTAEAGLGKTAMLRSLTEKLNPHTYRVFYVPETDFSRIEFYRQLAVVFELTPRYRRNDQWRELKQRIIELMDHKNVLPILIVDESQNLSPSFWRDLPAFLNFAFDSRDMMTIWFLGLPELDVTLSRACYGAINSRIQIRHRLHPIDNKEPFKKLVLHGLEEAGCTHTLLSESGIELVRCASGGNPRLAHRVLVTGLRLAAEKNMNHLPDEVIEEAITML